MSEQIGKKAPDLNTKNEEATDEVQNVHGEDQVSETQQKLQAKAKELVELLNQEPQARLQPFLREIEGGFTPDVKLLLVENQKDERDNETTDGSEGDQGEGTEQSKPTESKEA